MGQAADHFPHSPGTIIFILLSNSLSPILYSIQNGSIWDGLMLWKRNLDKKFQGVEECYICYSILHSSNYQIPKLSCRTCHKKFHSSCLVSTLFLFSLSVRVLTASFCCCSTAGSTQATTPPVHCAGTCSKTRLLESQDGNALPARNFLFT
jgi:hypothetical protein